MIKLLSGNVHVLLCGWGRSSQGNHIEKLLQPSIQAFGKPAVGVMRSRTSGEGIKGLVLRTNYRVREEGKVEEIYQTFLSEGLGLFSGFLILFSIFQNFLQ